MVIIGEVYVGQQYDKRRYQLKKCSCGCQFIDSKGKKLRKLCETCKPKWYSDTKWYKKTYTMSKSIC